MSYLGYIKPISEMLYHIDSPNILEIGIDYGQSALPLIHNLSAKCDSFTYYGIDIKIRGEVIEQLLQMKNVFCHGINSPSDDHTNVALCMGNSLDVLPDFKKENMKFDLILIDGDHNYFTVSKELDIIKDMSHPSTIIICDDYNSRWAEQDLYYSEKETYAKNELATKRKNTEKVGVRNAILDFLEKNTEWSLVEYDNDPCFIFQREHINFGFDFSKAQKTISLATVFSEFKTNESIKRFKRGVAEQYASHME